jgi:preprotein translocase subunit SecD
VQQFLETYQEDLRRQLREADIRFSGLEIEGDALTVGILNESDMASAERIIRNLDRGEQLIQLGQSASRLEVTPTRSGERMGFRVRLTESAIRERQDFAIEQNTLTLRNRVNELGVAETVVQRQGLSRILVQLPGVTDPAQAKRVLGSTATVEFHLVDSEGDAYAAMARGRAPAGSELQIRKDGSPILLRRDVIASGAELTDATSGYSQGQPAVFVRLNAQGARRMLDTTAENVGRYIAVLFIETRPQFIEGEDGELTRGKPHLDEEVINDAVIQGVFSSNFQITGLTPFEANNLALLLRAGSLAAPIEAISERVIGPSLGQDNIERGLQAVFIGYLLVVVFMIVYYRMFGLLADLALLVNVVLLVAIMSLFGAVLTLPGIAGIVLTVGMAVDANVLIYERIREELRNGNSPQQSIRTGFDKAFSTIVDANVTTFIAAVVLFAFGTGPIKGFAVTLSIGIATSMFSAIAVTRALVNLTYGSRPHVKHLSIGGNTQARAATA